MWLKMYLDNLLIDQQQIDLTGRDDYERRKRTIDGYVEKMLLDHSSELNGMIPSFVIRASSKMNDKFFHLDSDLEKMTWAEIKMYFKLKAVSNGTNNREGEIL